MSPPWLPIAKEGRGDGYWTPPRGASTCASAPTPALSNLFTQTGDPSIKNINLIQSFKTLCSLQVHVKPFSRIPASPGSDTRSHCSSSHPRSSWGLWICWPPCASHSGTVVGGRATPKGIPVPIPATWDCSLMR